MSLIELKRDTLCSLLLEINDTQSSYHALFWDSSLDLAAHHLGQGGAVLRRSEAPLGLGSAGLGGGGGDTRWLAPRLIHVHVQTVPLPRRTLQKERPRQPGRFTNANTGHSELPKILYIIKIGTQLWKCK